MRGPEVDEALIQVVRPAAVVPEAAARAILTGMAVSSVCTDGLWLAEASRWVRYDRPWTHPIGQGRTTRLGTVRVTYGMPAKNEITLFQIAVTQAGLDAGLTAEDLADEALGFGGLTLAGCLHASAVAPKPSRH